MCKRPFFVSAGTVVVVAALFVARTAAEESTASSMPRRVEFQGHTWECYEVQHTAACEYHGKSAMRVRGTRPTSSIILSDVRFQNGTIDVDIAPRGRAYSGIGFRGRDGKQWRNEIIFNRWPARGKDKDTSLEQAVLTRRENNVLILNIRDSMPDDAPDDATPTTGNLGWLHVRLVIRERAVRVYIADADEPTIELNEVFDGHHVGSIGLLGADFCFANFRYSQSR